MNTLDKMYLKTKFAVTGAVRRFFLDEEGDVNIVSMVVLMGMAVILAILFKDKVSGLLDTLFGTLTSKADNAIKNGN